MDIDIYYHNSSIFMDLPWLSYVCASCLVPPSLRSAASPDTSPDTPWDPAPPASPHQRCRRHRGTSWKTMGLPCSPGYFFLVLVSVKTNTIWEVWSMMKHCPGPERWLMWKIFGRSLRHWVYWRYRRWYRYYWRNVANMAVVFFDRLYCKSLRLWFILIFFGTTIWDTPASRVIINTKPPSGHG